MTPVERALNDVEYSNGKLNLLHDVEMTIDMLQRPNIHVESVLFLLRRVADVLKYGEFLRGFSGR